ncbi:MAG TPA: S8 family serine peptidase [Thermoanaerobaculia bacterium]|nr:S8 family serine peptidase [Thermoanaerobaculia bacterium]
MSAGRALGAVAAVALAAAGCSSTGSQSPRPQPEAGPAAVRAAEDGDLLVVLRPLARSPAEVIDRLALRYRLVPRAAWSMKSLGRECVVFDVIGGRLDPGLAARLQEDHSVELAQVNRELEVRAAAAQPSRDPHADLQYARALLRIDQAHRRATGRGVRVGVVDTGADVDHPDLRGQVDEARSFVADKNRFATDRHGTAIAGVIAARTDNGLGIGGVAPGVRLHLLKACWYRDQAPDGPAVCSSYTLALALDHAVVARYDLVNLSLGGPDDPLLARLVAAGASRGMIFVAPADEQPGDGFLAGLDAVLRTVAVDGRGEPQRPAAAGAALAAPGVEVLSTVPGGGFDFFTGPSLAAAHLTGVLALLLEALGLEEDGDGAALARELAAILRSTARPVAAGGEPVIDAGAALAELTAAPRPRPTSGRRREGDPR